MKHATRSDGRVSFENDDLYDVGGNEVHNANTNPGFISEAQVSARHRAARYGLGVIVSMRTSDPSAHMTYIAVMAADCTGGATRP